MNTELHLQTTKLKCLPLLLDCGEVPARSSELLIELPNGPADYMPHGDLCMHTAIAGVLLTCCILEALAFCFSHQDHGQHIIMCVY